MHLRNFTTSLLILLLAFNASCNYSKIKTPPRPLSKGALLEIYKVGTAKDADGKFLADPQSGEPVHLRMPPVIVASDVATLQKPLIANKPYLLINLTPNGAHKMSVATSSGQVEHLAVVVDGKIVTVAMVTSPLSKSIKLSGSASKDTSLEKLFKALTE